MRRRSPRRAMPIFSTTPYGRRPSARAPSSPASRPPRSCRSKGRAVKDDVARQQRVRRLEQRIEQLSGQLKEAQRKLNEARIPPEFLDLQRKVRCIARTTIPIPDHSLPHWQAALEAERNCEYDLEHAHGDIEREIAEEEALKATAARERMWLDIHEFGGWLHDERKQLSRRGRPPDPEVEYKSKRSAAGDTPPAL